LAVRYREGSSYYLDNADEVHQAHSTSDEISRKAKLWHHRLGHLGAQGMEELAKSEMVGGIYFDGKLDFGFCECCIEGKNHRQPFHSSAVKRANQPLELVHSDVCG